MLMKLTPIQYNKGTNLLRKFFLSYFSSFKKSIPVEARKQKTNKTSSYANFYPLCPMPPSEKDQH
jgi:hypothetical protein